MITRDSLKELLTSLNEKEVANIINQQEDWILMECHVFNSGHVIVLESRDWDDEVDAIAAETGDLFLDKDSFLELAQECGITWKL